MIYATDDEIIKGLSEGKTPREIAEHFGYAHENCIYTRARNLGINVHVQRDKVQSKKEQIKQMRDDGLLYPEIAENLGLSKEYVGDVCQQIGRAYTREERREVHPQKESDEWARLVQEKTDGHFDFVRVEARTKSSDAILLIRCTKHKREKIVSSQPLKPCHFSKPSNWHCSDCLKERDKAKRINEAIRRQGKAHKLKSDIKGQQGFIFCACGAIIQNNKRKCPDCLRISKRRQERKRETNRRHRMNGGDWSITLEQVFENDKGVCYLCGIGCDWNDYETRGGAFIAGEKYPSIDHVVPLAKGGTHEWSNVRLACRHCNSIKKDNIPPGPINCFSPLG